MEVWCGGMSFVDVLWRCEVYVEVRCMEVWCGGMSFVDVLWRCRCMWR